MATPRTAEDIGGGLPRNFVRSCVLLLTAESESHGYDLLDRLSSLGVVGADAGGLYRILRSMEQEGLLESRWETSDAGPARRTYTLTEEGMDWLHAWAGAHRETIRTLDRFIDRYQVVAEANDPHRADR
ncbi:MAG: helix-turn-helix transcriptional regulator [Acidimicrobiia bacterium]